MDVVRQGCCGDALAFFLLFFFASLPFSRPLQQPSELSLRLLFFPSPSPPLRAPLGDWRRGIRGLQALSIANLPLERQPLFFLLLLFVPNLHLFSQPPPLFAVPRTQKHTGRARADNGPRGTCRCRRSLWIPEARQRRRGGRGSSSDCRRRRSSNRCRGGLLLPAAAEEAPPGARRQGARQGRGGCRRGGSRGCCGRGERRKRGGRRATGGGDNNNRSSSCCRCRRGNGGSRRRRRRQQQKKKKSPLPLPPLPLPPLLPRPRPEGGGETRRQRRRAGGSSGSSSSGSRSDCSSSLFGDQRGRRRGRRGRRSPRCRSCRCRLRPLCERRRRRRRRPPALLDLDGAVQGRGQAHGGVSSR